MGSEWRPRYSDYELDIRHITVLFPTEAINLPLIQSFHVGGRGV
jgi:hypothetical protein